MTAVNYPGTVYLRVVIDLQVEFSKFTVVWYTAGNMRIPPHVMSCFIITTLSTHQTLTLPLHAQNLPFHLDYLDRSLHQTYHVHSFSSFLPRDTIHSMPYTQQTVRERERCVVPQDWCWESRLSTNSVQAGHVLQDWTDVLCLGWTTTPPSDYIHHRHTFLNKQF